MGLDRTMVPGMAIATDGNNGSNSDNPLARLSWATHSDLYAEIMSEDGFDLEFGAVNYGSEGEKDAHIGLCFGERRSGFEGILYRRSADGQIGRGRR